MTDKFETAQFIQGFIAEAEEHLRAANAYLLSIEQAGSDQATPRQVRELFRSLHTIKGLAGMVGVEPIVVVAHAMETLLREADRASGRLADGALEPLLEGVRAIEQRVQSVERGQPVAAAPAALIVKLETLQSPGGGAAARLATGQSTLEPALWLKLSAAEREQLLQGLLAGRRGLVVRFCPSPALASAGVNITAVRERLASIAEIVKVLPESVPVSPRAPGGLMFALVVLTGAEPAVVAEAAASTPEALVPIGLQADSTDPTTEGDALDDPASVEPRQRGIVRVEVSRLDDALDKLAALVVTQFRLIRATAAMRAAGTDVRALSEVLADNKRQLRDLRASIMRARMVRVSELLERIPLLVRGLSRATSKKTRVELNGGQAELDKAVAERIFPAIVHLVRNAVDHALEPPGERLAAGKPETGLLSVTCLERSDNRLELTLADDGRGVDPVAVARRANQPIPTSDEALLDLLTRRGLSTKTEVTTTSGRGVGMDVVKRIAVNELHGELSMRTVPGKGTTFVLRIPLSITIVDAFSFACGGETFVVPVTMVEAIQELDLARAVRGPDRRKAPRGGPDRRKAVRAADLIERNGEAVPVLRLEELLGLAAPDPSMARKAIIVRRNGEPFAFVIDRMLGQQEVVVRPIEDPWVKVDGVSGTTDLGDGRPTLVLDLGALTGRLTGARAEALPA
ncbi:MAG TPA: chemotaxis protein CheW [Polyangia bacterium]|nr:chemotaxis protein CheW [Polyangia bacterium]